MNDAFGAGLAGINSLSNGGHRCKGSLAYGATRLPGSQVARRRVFSSAGPAMRAREPGKNSFPTVSLFVATQDCVYPASGA
ncbi:MAG: hypothetical protein Q8L91_07515 [Polaromonas sp.]|nr:hypothetical protein [Polaromonas sp.]